MQNSIKVNTDFEGLLGHIPSKSDAKNVSVIKSYKRICNY